jgi:hypothetical protein
MVHALFCHYMINEIHVDGTGTKPERVSLREYWIIYRGPALLAVVWFGSFPTTSPPPVRMWGGGGVVGRSQIIRQRESLVFYKSFNTLWFFYFPYIPHIFNSFYLSRVNDWLVNFLFLFRKTAVNQPLSSFSL